MLYCNQYSGLQGTGKIVVFFVVIFIYLFIVVAVYFKFVWQLDVFNLCLDYKLVIVIYIYILGNRKQSV